MFRLLIYANKTAGTKLQDLATSGLESAFATLLTLIIFSANFLMLLLQKNKKALEHKTKQKITLMQQHLNFRRFLLIRFFFWVVSTTSTWYVFGASMSITRYQRSFPRNMYFRKNSNMTKSVLFIS